MIPKKRHEIFTGYDRDSTGDDLWSDEPLRTGFSPEVKNPGPVIIIKPCQETPTTYA